MLERTVQEVEEAGIEQIVVVSSPNKPAIDTALRYRGVQIELLEELFGLKRSGMSRKTTRWPLCASWLQLGIYAHPL